MKRSEIREFLREGVNALTPAPEFGSGLITDFNSIRSHQYPAVWQTIAPVNPDIEFQAPVDSWEIILTIAQKDAMDSISETYEQIIDSCDEIGQKLIYQYRNVTAGYKLLTIEEIKREPFVKKYADCLTGIFLTFTIKAVDKTDVC